jgi:hypothetical protein
MERSSEIEMRERMYCTAAAAWMWMLAMTVA